MPVPLAAIEAIVDAVVLTCRMPAGL